MNAVEIESALSDLALQPFDTAEFPFAFLAGLRASPATATATAKAKFILATDGHALQAQERQHSQRQLLHRGRATGLRG